MWSFRSEFSFCCLIFLQLPSARMLSPISADSYRFALQIGKFHEAILLRAVHLPIRLPNLYSALRQFKATLSTGAGGFRGQRGWCESNELVSGTKWDPRRPPERETQI